MDSEEILSIQYNQDVYNKIEDISRHISQTIEFCKQKAGELKSQDDSYTHVKFFTYLNGLLKQHSDDLISAVEKKKSYLLVRNQEGLPIVDIHEEVDEDGNVIKSNVKPQRISSVTDYADVIRSLPGFQNPKEKATTPSKPSATELPETRIEELPAEAAAATGSLDSDEQITKKNNTEFQDRENASQYIQQTQSDYVKEKASTIENKTDLTSKKIEEKEPEKKLDEKKNKKSVFKKGFLSNPKNGSQNRSTKAKHEEESKKQSQREEKKRIDVTDNNAVKEVVMEKSPQESNSQKQLKSESPIKSKPPKKLSKFKEAKLQRSSPGRYTHSEVAENESTRSETDGTNGAEPTKKVDSLHEEDKYKEVEGALKQVPTSTEDSIAAEPNDEDPVLLPVPTDANGESIMHAVQYDGLNSLDDMEQLLQDMEEAGELQSDAESGSDEDEHGMSLNFSRNLIPPPNPNYFGENESLAPKVASGSNEHKENALSTKETQPSEKHVHFSDTLEIKHVSRNGKARIENVPTPTEEYDNMFEPHEYCSRISAFRKARSKIKSEHKDKDFESPIETHKGDKRLLDHDTIVERSSDNPPTKSDPEEKLSDEQNEENLVEKYLNEVPTVKSTVVERQPARSVEQAKEDFEDHQDFVKDKREISQRYYELRRKLVNPETEDTEEEGVVPVDENGNEQPKLSKFMAARLGGKL
ncbi:fungal protein [Schizosaccharomyces cryophilus OY26]|uniref:Fungal protein n=1 Tax=Schizosaccharomyces cryophilus (strain OY26 / ATCC MYA-4695 / CBS 11777 / NBRC 106824 / NRRL Y48691) TaxID=653667 RepID=S9VV03_SCHCR|nr:uncharacterized protein SPOG_03488 [Schizosaccharomyces cryophilus OY26]EPY50019.1 fungal protein [Schizosaccharomyces cryophilus OY26]